MNRSMRARTPCPAWGGIVLLNIKPSFGELLIEGLGAYQHSILVEVALDGGGILKMNKDDNEFSKVAQFVLEANNICQEFFAPGGGDPDKEAYEDEKSLRVEILRLIKDKNLQELKSLQADYLAILQADDEEDEHHRIVNQRLVDASGFDLISVEESIVNTGKRIIAADAIETKEGYHALYRYFDYLKDNGSPLEEVLKVEKLLARYSSEFD